MKKRKITFLLLAVTLCLQLLFLAACGSGADYLEKASKNLSVYEITALFDPAEKAVKADQKLTYRNNTDNALKELRLHLYPNAFRENAVFPPVNGSDETVAYPYGKNYGKIEILKTSADGKNAAFKIGGDDKNILAIPFGRELFPGESIKIDISFVSYFPKMNHRFSYNDRVFNAGNFYPIACVWEDGGFVEYPYYCYGDPFYSDMANYEVALTFPKNYITAATGDAVSRTENGTRQTVVFSARCVRDFAFVSSDKFTVLSGKYNETAVNYYYLEDEKAAKSLDVSVKSLGFFSQFIGEYPYGTLNVVQTDFCYGGMEYPNLVYISSGLNEEENEKVIAHEIAHQWWYNLVGNDQVRYAWLDEGLTEFTTAYFFKKTPETYISEFEKLVSRAEKSYSVYTDIVKNYGGQPDTTMDRPVNEFRTQQQYVVITYAKGMLMFNSLYNALGEKRFEKAVKLYFNENKTKKARPENLINCFEKAFGADLESYFKTWFGSGGVVLQ